MLWSKMIALQGEMYRGIARVEQRQGGVAVLCTLRPQPKGALTAYLITPGEIKPVPLQDGQGSAPAGTPAPIGVLVAQSAPMVFLAQGAPRGTRLDFEAIKLRLRLEEMWSGNQAAAAAEEVKENATASGPAAQITKAKKTRQGRCADPIKSFSSRTGRCWNPGPGRGARRLPPNARPGRPVMQSRRAGAGRPSRHMS